MGSLVYHVALFSTKTLSKCLLTGKTMNTTQNSTMVVFISTGTSIHEKKIHCKNTIIQEDIRYN